MLDRLMSFLSGVPTGQNTSVFDRNDPRVATAALLFQVMDADGIRRDEEMKQLRQALKETYDLDPSQIEELYRAGETAEQEAIDFYGFTSVLARELDRQAKLDLIELLWEMVYTDGVVHELEDSTVWRVAELLHVEREDRIALRQRVEGRTSTTP
jgi:uncharacterized tellurite resistance protein B-like protein